MAYSNTWDVTRPAGSVLANQIDTEIQAVRKDLQERLMTLFGLSVFTTDPLQGISLNLKGTTTSKIVPGSVSLSLRNNADSADNLLITDAGIVLLRGALTGTASTTGGELLFANSKSVRAMNAASTDSIALIFADGNNTVRVGSASLVSIGSPGSINSAIAGDLLLPNARALRAANAAGTNTLSMWSVTAADVLATALPISLSATANAHIRSALDAYPLANTATLSFPGTGALVLVYDSNTGNSGIIAIAGAAGTVLVGANFSGISGNPGTYNVYSTGGNIVIQNNRGATASLSIMILRGA